MPHTPSRRTVLRGVTLTGAAVIGFDPGARSWATPEAGSGSGSEPGSASTSASGRNLVGIPPLDGTLVMDDASLSAASEDYGHIVHRRPAAVLRPGSVRDVVAMVRFCNRHRLPVAPRGQGHATNGQAQVEGGLVVETATLADIGPVRPHSATVTVGAGARWSEVAKAAIAHGLTPPVFTDYLELSVGGTLSVGGLGGQSHRHGAQVDNVAELQVVTGAGEFVRCSPTRHPDLFHAVLAGLGQCAIVVGATLRLVTAPRTVRHYLLPYDDLQTFLDDQRILVQEGRFDYVEGQVAPDADGAFRVLTLEGPPPTARRPAPRRTTRSCCAACATTRPGSSAPTAPTTTSSTGSPPPSRPSKRPACGRTPTPGSTCSSRDGPRPPSRASCWTASPPTTSAPAASSSSTRSCASTSPRPCCARPTTRCRISSPSCAPRHRRTRPPSTAC